MNSSSENKEHAEPYSTVWFLNIHRMLSKLKVSLDEYSLVDVGCGRGVAAYYINKKYNFKKVSGFDFDDNLILDAKYNMEMSRNYNPERKINFFVADADSHILSEGKHVIFMFNPFGLIIMKRFLDNNIDIIKKNKMIIAYANHRQLDLIKSYSPVKIDSIERYNCSVIYF
jgi:ribosomal protein L11 methylase PrmA